MEKSILRKVASTCIALSLIVALLPNSFYAQGEIAYASEDSAAPVLNDFTILSPTVQRPATVQFKLNIAEEGSGVSDLSLYLKWQKGSTQKSGGISTGLEYGGASGDMCSGFKISLDENGKQFGDYTGEYIINLILAADVDISEYTVSSIEIRDKEGNRNSYETHSLKNLSQNGNTSFEVTGSTSGEDGTAPSLKSLQIIGSPVGRPGNVKLVLDVEEADSGLSDISISCSWLKGSMPQSGSIGTGLEYGGASGDMCSNFKISLDPASKKFGEKSGKYIVNLAIGERANVSKYEITDIWVRDKARNERRYSSTLLKGLTLGGNNFFETIGDTSTDDFVAPKLVSYEISSPVVNRPGVVKLALNVAEEGSGVSDIDVSLSWTNNGSRKTGSIGTGLEYGGASGDMCSNFKISLDHASKKFGEKSGKYIVNLALGPRADLATYTIDRIWIRDRYGNIAETGEYGYSKNELNPLIALAANGDNTFKLKDEFNYSFTTGSNNPSLATQLASMPEGTAAKIEAVGTKVLSKACLDAIKGKDKTIVTYDGGIQWVIQGKNLNGITKNLHLKTSCSKVSAGSYYQNPFASSDESESASGDNNYGEAVWTVPEDTIKLEFYPNGTLPGPMQIRFKSDFLYDKGISGNSPSLYYIDGDSIKLEEEDCDLNFDGTDKWCYVTVFHNSTFAVTTTKKTPLSKKTLPKHKATFKNEGKTVGVLKRTKAQSLGKLPAIVKKGYLLKGWYTKKKGGKKITATSKIKSNQTFYAQWMADSVSAPSCIVNDAVSAKAVKFTAKAVQSCKLAKQYWKAAKLNTASSNIIMLTKYKNVAVKNVALTNNYQPYAKLIKFSKQKNCIKITLKKGCPKLLKKFKFMVTLKNGNAKTFTFEVR